MFEIEWTDSSMLPRQVEILEEGAARPAALLGFVRLIHALAGAKAATSTASRPASSHAPDTWQPHGEKIDPGTHHGGSAMSHLGSQRCSIVVDSGTGTSAVGEWQPQQLG